MNGYLKWLGSTKFQVCVLAMGLIYLEQPFYGLSPVVAAGSLEKLAICYMGARILEPVVEYVLARLGKKSV